MTKLEQIRAAILTILKTVEGIGNVYDYYRYVDSTKDLTTIGKDSKSFKLAMFRFLKLEDKTDNKLEVKRKWEITLLKQVNDYEASQKQIEDLAELVRLKFYEYDNLNGTIIEHNNIQIVNIYEDYYSEILCHWAILELETIE